MSELERLRKREPLSFHGLRIRVLTDDEYDALLDVAEAAQFAAAETCPPGVVTEGEEIRWHMKQRRRLRDALAVLEAQPEQSEEA